MAVGEISYAYTPAGWNQSRFLELGGFSVVFLNYNKAAFIEKAVAAALDQDFPLLEMFFMDDASTDGSGDVMEALVRQYRGRHKVTVVRNTENQHITGQWNIVGRLATGTWLGMFCADDIAFPDRVSQTREVIARHPGLLGLSTSGIEANYITGCRTREIGAGIDPFSIDAQASTAELARKWLVVVGATAFWHRSLFDAPLPKGPMDDEIIFYRLLARRQSREGAVYRFASDVRTVTYAIGTGISTEGRARATETDSKYSLWVKQVRAQRHQNQVYVRTWRGVVDSPDYAAASADMRGYARLRLWLARIVAGNTGSRLLMAPGLLVELLRPGMGGAMKLRVLRLWLKKLVHEFLGLHVAALREAFRR